MENKLEKLSDWDLVNSFITSVWWLKLNTNPNDRRAYGECLRQADMFKDEVMRRLSIAKE